MKVELATVNLLYFLLFCCFGLADCAYRSSRYNSYYSGGLEGWLVGLIVGTVVGIIVLVVVMLIIIKVCCYQNRVQTMKTGPELQAQHVPPPPPNGYYAGPPQPMGYYSGPPPPAYNPGMYPQSDPAYPPPDPAYPSSSGFAEKS